MSNEQSVKQHGAFHSQEERKSGGNSQRTEQLGTKKEKLENGSKKSRFKGETDKEMTVQKREQRQKLKSRETEEKDLTAGTELMFICCGWFMGEGARAPMGA